MAATVLGVIFFHGSGRESRPEGHRESKLTSSLSKDGPMPADPIECRANARQCMELAAGIGYPELSDTFRELAGRWTKLAAALEQAARRKRPAPRKSKKN